MNKVFVTGANGFLGKHLCSELTTRGISFIPGVRTAHHSNEVSYGDINTFSDWNKLLKDIDVVIHLAARVHVMKDKASNPLNEFLKSNCEATLNLAKAAKSAGVRRFIFISTVKVNGEETFETPFKSSDVPAPIDPYGVSKFEAEKGLLLLHEAGHFEVVIIRPPLIYGPKVKANFQKLFEIVQKGFPLPFNSVNNKRSFVSVFNLIDLIILCIQNPKASGRVFLVSDDNDLSLKELITKMANVSRRKLFLFSVPLSLMKFGASVLGKKAAGDRIFGNLQVEIKETKEILGWTPKFTFESTYGDKA